MKGIDIALRAMLDPGDEVAHSTAELRFLYSCLAQKLLADGVPVVIPLAA